MRTFGVMPSTSRDAGREVLLARLENTNGMAVEILTLGGIIQRLIVPDRQERLADVVLGHDSPKACLAPESCPAAIVGRCANRIGGAAFCIDGVTSKLENNNHGNCLHSGSGNYAGRVFDTIHADVRRLTLELRDEGGPEWGGFPGGLKVTVEYSLSDDNALTVRYAAEAQCPTVVNLTSHAYFNLAGHDSAPGGGAVRNHELQTEADFYTTADAFCLPDGEIRTVTGTPLDFRNARRVGEAIDDLINRGCPYGGLDHNLVIRERGMRRAATLHDPASGRSMDVFTGQPGIQLYSANHLDGTLGKDGVRYGRHQALCLETQHFPNAVNVSHFPDPVIRPEKPFASTTLFLFRAR